MSNVFVLSCPAFGIPKPILEHRFDLKRRFRFDIAWLDKKVALEVEGGIYRKGGGAHSGITAQLRDIEKYNLATVQGWRVLRVEPKNLLKTETFEMVKKCLEL